VSSVLSVVQLKLSNICSLTVTLQTLFGILCISLLDFQPPTSFANLFGSWLHGLCPKLINQILPGAAALCWAIWLNRNDMVFNKAKSNTFMHVIFKATYRIRQWSMLHTEEVRPLFMEGCRRWKTLLLTILAKFGRGFRNRIEA